MYIYFSYEDIVGNLFLTLRKLEIYDKKISFALIEDFRDLLYKSLEEKGYEPSHDFSRDTKNSFLSENADLYCCEDDTYIVLEKDLSTKQLTDMYVGCLNLDAIKIMESKDFKNAVLDVYEEEIVSNYESKLQFIKSKKDQLKNKK